MRRLVLPLALASVLAPLGAVAPGCGGGGGGGGGAPPAAVSGMVLGYTEDPLADVPLAVVGAGVGGASRVDGLILLGPVPSGRRVLRVGDSVTTPTLYVPFDALDAGAFLERPVYLPALESGIGANLPAAITTSTTVTGTELPAVALDLAAGTAVALPAGAAGQVRVVAVSPSRLPSRLPGGVVPRAAFLVEPAGLTFTPAATLRIPRLDPASAGPFDAWEVSPTTGEWQLLQSSVPAAGADGLAVTVPRGALVAVAPRAPAPTTTLVGRVVSGSQPLAGFRVEAWGRVSDVTGADGRFTITDVPTTFGLFYGRGYPARPGVDFAPAVTIGTATASNLGDFVVTARAPDAIDPEVRSTSPTDGQRDLGPDAQVVVTFSEAIDRVVPSTPVRLFGRAGQVAARVNFDNAFTVRLIPTKPLELSDQFTILVDRDVRDLAGNRIDDGRLAFTFTTRGGTPPAPPTDTLAFSLAPLTAGRGATVSIAGRNFTGGTAVTFGGTSGLVTGETDEEVRAVVPDFQPAGDVTVALAAGGVAVPVVRPLTLDLRAQVAAVYSGTTPDTRLAVLDRDRPPAQVVVAGGNVGGTGVSIEGLSIAAVDSTVTVGAATVAAGRTVTLGAPAPATLLTGPVVLRGANGKAGLTYRFLFVREGP